jgi:hypothetical protein
LLGAAQAVRKSKIEKHGREDLHNSRNKVENTTETEMHLKQALLGFSFLWFVGLVSFNLVSMYGVYVMTGSMWDALNWP